MPFLKKILSIFLRVVISVFLLWLLFRQLDKTALVDIVKNSDKRFIIAAFIVSLFGYVLAILRWRMLLKAAKINIPLKRIVISVCGGNFFSLFLPSTIGGDVVRVIDMATHTNKPHEVMATVFLDRLSGYIGLVILAWSGLLCARAVVKDKGIIISILAITAVLLVVLLVLFNKYLFAKINKLLQSSTENKFKQNIRDVHREIHIFRRHKKVALYNILVSVLIQMINPVSFYLTALSLGLNIKLTYFFIVMPIIGAVTLLPISIGGLGLREYMTQLFFASSVVSAHSTFAMSFVNSLIILIYGCLGGLVYVLTVRHRRIQRHPSSAILKAGR